MVSPIVNGPTQPADHQFPGRFRPSKRDECSPTPAQGGWGNALSTHQYIWYGNIDAADYPIEACKPWFHAFAKINSLRIDNTATGPADIQAGITGTGGISIGGDIFAKNATFSANLYASSVSGAIKEFNIEHPTKENKRLVHACLEGPEAGVYIRGRLTDANVINLPDYWEGLVDPESITVTLTQIRTSQDLIVDGIEWGKRVKVKSGNASTIDCFYTIYGTRKDVPPLEVEPDA